MDRQDQTSGGRLNIKMSSYQYSTSMLKLRRSHDRLIFNMRIPIPERRSFYWDGAQLVSIHLAVRVLTAKFHEVSYRSEIWQASRQHCRRNSRVIGKVLTGISWLRGFTRAYRTSWLYHDHFNSAVYSFLWGLPQTLCWITFSYYYQTVWNTR